MNKVTENKAKDIQKETKPLKKEVDKDNQLEKKLDKPLKKVEKKPEVKKAPDDASVGVGINLIPTMTKEEVVIQESKKKLNVGAVVSLLLLILVSLGIVGFNIISKMQVNAAKEKLYAHENEILGQSQKIVNNNEILERVVLYKEIQEAAFSPKDVIEYIDSITKKSGQGTVISDYVFGTDLSFEFSGKSNDLEDVSKLWYLLSHDSKVEEINLESVGKSSENVSFSFEGKLVFEDFITLSE